MPLNDDRFNQVSNSDPEIKKELFKLYFETFDRSIKNMEDSITNNDEKKWNDAIHELKGAADNLGINKVGKICGEVEPLTPSANEKTEIDRKSVV